MTIEDYINIAMYYQRHNIPFSFFEFNEDIPESIIVHIWDKAEKRLIEAGEIGEWRKFEVEE